jgi:hypothetical protein
VGVQLIVLDAASHIPRAASAGATDAFS